MVFPIATSWFKLFTRILVLFTTKFSLHNKDFVYTLSYPIYHMKKPKPDKNHRNWKAKIKVFWCWLQTDTFQQLFSLKKES